MGDTVWMRWTCEKCGFEGNTMEPNHDFHTVQCAQCGKAHTNEKPYLLGEDGKPVVFETATVNGKTVEAASDEKTVISKNDKEDKFDDQFYMHQGKKWTCPSCKASNFHDDYTCTACGALRDDVPIPATVAKKPFMIDPKNRVKIAKIGGAAVATFLVIGGVKWAFSTKDYPGTITNVTWEQHIEVETFSLVKKRAWRDEIASRKPTMPVNGRGEDPGQFNIRNCSQEYYKDEEYQDGYKTVEEDVYGQVPYQETVDDYTDESYEEDAWVSNGDGTATKTKVTKSRKVKSVSHQVTKYRQEKTGTKEVQVPNMKTRPVYKEQCDYDTYEWKHKDSLVTSGSNLQPDSSGHLHLEWPNANLGRYDRETRSTNYQVYFSYDSGQRKDQMSVATPEELALWTKGAAVTVTRSNMGVVTKVVRKLSK